MAVLPVRFSSDVDLQRTTTIGDALMTETTFLAMLVSVDDCGGSILSRAWDL
jgi:hypothetical protein